MSLVPSTTETICALGARGALVACTRYCVEPLHELADVTRVGGTKNPMLEAVARLGPDLVLANAEENRSADIDWLRSRVPVMVQTPRTVVEAAACLRQLAMRLGAMEAAVPFLVRIEAQIAAAAVACLDREPLRVFYPIWRKPWMSVNRETYIHDVLRMAGAENVCADFDCRYPEIPLEWLLSRKVEAVLLPSEPWAWTASDRSALESERTLGSARIGLCDGRDFCWHGVRAADGLGNATRIVSALQRSRPPGD